jgi:hypothetical protein
MKKKSSLRREKRAFWGGCNYFGSPFDSCRNSIVYHLDNPKLAVALGNSVTNFEAQLAHGSIGKTKEGR